MILLTPSQVAAHLTELGSLLARACERSCGEYSVCELLGSAVAGHVSIFVPSLSQMTAVAAVDIFESFGYRYAFVLAIGGKAHDLYEDLELFNMWAAEMGCKEVRMACDEARERLFRRQGFKKLYSVCSYLLEERP